MPIDPFGPIFGPYLPIKRRPGFTPIGTKGTVHPSRLVSGTLHQVMLEFHGSTETGLRSQNFVTGTTGWALFGDGTAQLHSITGIALGDLDDVTLSAVSAHSVVVEQTATSTQAFASNSMVFSLPTGLTNGNLLIAFCSLDTTDPDPTPPSGWTELKQQESGNTFSYIIYRTVNGTEGSTATIDITPWPGQMAAVCYEISGWTGTPEVSTGAAGSSTAPNPDALTPSWGADGIVFAFASIDSDRTVSAYPTGYDTGQLNLNGENTTVAIARKDVGSTTEDPDAFTITVGDTWVAHTVAIEPSTPASALPADNEILGYDSGSALWINQTAAELGISATGHTHVEADVTDLDHLTGAEALTYILANDGTGSTLDADLLDGVELAAIQSEIDSDITTHAGAADPHGDRAYADSLDHDHATPIATHAAIAAAHHAKYTDGEADARIAAASIDDLSDVVVTGTPADNEVLAWDTGTGKWINQTAAEAALAAATHAHDSLYDASANLRVNVVDGAGGDFRVFNAAAQEQLNVDGATGDVTIPVGGLDVTVGNITVGGTVDGVDVASHHGGSTFSDHPAAVAGVSHGFMSSGDKTKLDGIETAATQDQTAGEILTAIKTVDGTGSGLDADLLDGVELAAIQSEIDSDITTHAGDVDAHHDKHEVYADNTGIHTPSGTSAETVGTKVITNPSRQVDIYVVVTGYYDDNTNASMNVTLTADISVDGGSTWNPVGTVQVAGRTQCGTTAGRYGDMTGMTWLEAVTPTGNIHVRVQVNVNATGGALDASAIQVHIE